MTLFQTPPLQIVDAPAAATHYTRGREGHTPRFIIIHHSAGTDSLLWLSHTSSPPVSCHNLISKLGVNFKIVPPADTAYCAGFGVVGPVDPDRNDPPGVAPNLNYASLNIELENLGNGKDPYPAAQMQMCAAQIVEWWGMYGFLAVLGHSDVDPAKNDPKGFDWGDLWRRMYGLMPFGALTDNAAARRAMELAAGHIQTGLGDIAAAMAALK